MSNTPTWPVGFYAPGNYTCICNLCGKHHVADKRAVHCADCTIQACYREVERLRALPAAQPATVAVGALVEAATHCMWSLENLRALVEGECPRVLDEDRGGDANLALKIESDLSDIRAALRALAGDKP